MEYSRRRFMAVSGSAASTALVTVACSTPGAPGTPTTATTPEVRATASQPAVATPVPTRAASPTAAAAVKPTAGAAPARKVVFWSAFSGQTGKATEALVARFNQRGGSLVELQYQGSYEETAQKLVAGLAARQAPEVAVLGSYVWPRFYLNESLAPLDDLLRGAGVDTSDFIQSLYIEGVRDGQAWMLPFARSTPLFYYNRDMLASAGLPTRGPKTWDEFTEWAPRLAKKDGDTLNVAAMSFLPGQWNMAWVFMAMVWQWGGRLSTDISSPDFRITIDEPPSIAAGDYLRDLIHRRKVANVPKDTRVDFASSLTATTISSTAELEGIVERVAGRFQVGTAFLPEQQQFGCPTGGPALGVMAAAPVENRPAAVEFLAFATSPEQQTVFAQETGYMPVRTSSVQSPEMRAYYERNPNARVAVDQLAKARPQDDARVFIPSGDGIIGRALDRIMLNDEEPAAVLGQAAQELTTAAQPVLAALRARRRQ